MFSQPFTIPAVLFLLFSVPLLFGLIPPNRFVGVRTAKTLADPARWYRTNRVAGVALIGSSLIYLAVAFLFPSVRAGETDFGRWLIHLAAFAGSLFISLGMVRNVQ